MCSFIVESPLYIGFEIELEADVAVWRSDIDLVDARGLIRGF
jgi:hypothetical protein